METIYLKEIIRGLSITIKHFFSPKVTDGPAGSRGHRQQNIRIDWRVTDKDDKEVGIATQLHDIPAHSMDGMWGDIAMAAAEEAAGAVEEMITRYSSRDARPIPKPQDAAKNK